MGPNVRLNPIVIRTNSITPSRSFSNRPNTLGHQ